MSDSDIFIKLLPEIFGDPAAAKVYNPVVCYGSPIALSSAAKWADSMIEEKLPGVKIVRISGQAFINRMLHLLMESGDIPCFIKSCCDGDVLVLADLEAFAGKELACENLYYILDDYLLRGHTILTFADAPPSGIPNLPPRIRAQLEGGILLDLGRDPIDIL